MKVAKVTVHVERCKNCGCCLEACPVKAISVSQYKNKQGYKAVQVDKTKCVGCGNCYTVCPDYVFEIC